MKSKTDHRKRTLVEEHPGSYSLYRRGNNAYVCRYVGSNGKTRYVTLKTKRTARVTNIEAARAECETLAQAKRERKDMTPADGKQTFADLAAITFENLEALVISGERKQRTLDDYRWRWSHYLEEPVGNIKLKDLSREHLYDVLNDLRRKGLSTETVQSVRRLMSVIVSEGRERGWLTFDVRFTGQRRIKVRRARQIFKPTPEEISAIVKAASTRWQALFLFEATTGARASEALGLTWADLNLVKDEATVSITKQLTREGTLGAPKTENGYRTLRIGEGLRVALLAEYNRAGDKRPDAFVFAQDTEAVGRYGLGRRAFATAVTRAGIEFDRETQRLSQHCFRHTTAKRMLRQGFSVDQVAAYLGDTVQTIVSTYLRQEENEKVRETAPVVLDVEVAA